VPRGKLMLIIGPFELSELCRPVLQRSLVRGIVKKRALNQKKNTKILLIEMLEVILTKIVSPPDIGILGLSLLA